MITLLMRLRSRGIRTFGLWCFSGAAILVTAVMGWGIALAVSLALNYVADALLYRTAPRITRWMGSRQLGSGSRAVFRQVFAVLGWVLDTGPTGTVVALAVATLAFIHATHVGYRMISARNMVLRGGRLRWANLDLNGEREGPSLLPPTLPTVLGVGPPRLVLHIDLLLMLGLAASALFDHWAPIGVAFGLTLIAAAAAMLMVVGRNRLIHRLPTPAEENAALLSALAATEPEVVVYFSGGRDTTYQLNVWLETIDALRRPAMIILRESHHLQTMLPTKVPIVVLPRAQDVETVHFASIKIALFPTTVIKNNHMIRLRGIKHIFINHGDGDKSVTYSPLHRVFDEIWVAGQAACDRYLHRGEGIRPEQLLRVGRPQLATIERWQGPPPNGAPVTVLYAPTWEGNFDGVNYSSVAPMGEAIIQQLLSMPQDIRVLFKPHPATGTRLKAAALARRAIEDRLNALPKHEVVSSEPSALYEAFNAANVLISDIGSVVADFLASRKPYLITNPRNEPLERYHADFPSTAGGGLVAADARNLSELIVDAVGPDVLRDQRHELAGYFLGEPSADPIGDFVAQVDRACERAEASA